MRLLLALIFIGVTSSWGWAGQGMGPGPGVKGYVAASNGEIGNKSGSNSDTDTFYTGTGSYISATTVTAGTISYLHASLSYAYGTPKQINMGIYSSDGTTKLGDGTLTTVGSGAAVAHVQLDTPVTIVAATTYRLVITYAGSDSIAVHTTNMSFHPTYHDSSFTASSTLDATVSGSSAQQYYGLRIWGTNTANGS